MNNIIELIKRRRSVRTYDGRVLDEGIKEQLLSYGDNIQNPFDIPVRFKLLNAKKDGLSCPVVRGTDLYVGGKIEKEGGYEHFKKDFGITTTYYENITVTGKSFEVLVDSIGNISGNVELPFLNDDYKAKKRTITGFIRVKIHGTVDAPIVEVLGATWDVTDYSITFNPPDDPGTDDPGHIFEPDVILLGEDGTQIIGEKHYNWTSKIYKGDNLIEIDEFELNPYCYLKGKLIFEGQISHIG